MHYYTYASRPAAFMAQNWHAESTHKQLFVARDVLYKYSKLTNLTCSRVCCRECWSFAGLRQHTGSDEDHLTWHVSSWIA